MAENITEIVRERYYDNQLLQVQDFEREQTYHVAQRELQTRLFYTPGVLAGLAVQNGGAGKVLVSAGVAIDGMGRLIVLAGGAKFGGSPVAAQGGVFTLDLKIDPSPYTLGPETKWLLTVTTDPNPDANDNQWIERPSLSLIAASARPDASQVVLARLQVKAEKPGASIELTVQVDPSIQVPATLSPERIPAVNADKIRGKLEPGVIPDLDAGQIKTGRLNPSLIPDLNADKIKTGKLAADLIPDLDAARITTGKLSRSVIPALAADSIPDLDAGKIKTGKLAVAQIPDIPADKIGSGKLSASVIPNLDASQITSGVLSLDRLPPDLLPPDQSKPKWQATTETRGGKNNTVRVLLDAYGFVHLSGTIIPEYSTSQRGTNDLLELPDNCKPRDIRVFRILDNQGEPWQITVFALRIVSTAGTSMAATYLGSKANPKTDNPALSLSLTGLSYALNTT